MALTTAETKQIVDYFKTSDLDTGSPQIQIAILTQRILMLTEHMKLNKHDNSTKKGLMQMVNKRRKLLDYLHRVDAEAYKKILVELDIRK